MTLPASQTTTETITDSSETTTAEAADPRKVPKFSQENLDSIIANERKEWQAKIAELESMKQTTSEKPKEQPKQTVSAPQGVPPELLEQISSLKESVETITKAFESSQKENASHKFSAELSKLSLTEGQAGILKSLHDAEKPQDVAAWMAEKAAVFGVAPKETQTKQRTTEGAMPSNGQSGVVNPLNLSRDQINSMNPTDLHKMAQKFFNGR